MLQEEGDIEKNFGCDFDEFVDFVKLVIKAGGEEANVMKEFLKRVL